MSHSAMYTSLIQHLQALSPSHPHTLCCQHITHASVLPQLSIDCLPLLITRSLPLFSYRLTLLVSLLSYYCYFICHPHFLSLHSFSVSSFTSVSHVLLPCFLSFFNISFTTTVIPFSWSHPPIPLHFSSFIFYLCSLCLPPLSFFDFPLSFELLFFLDSQSFIISCPK